MEEGTTKDSTLKAKEDEHHRVWTTYSYIISQVSACVFKCFYYIAGLSPHTYTFLFFK